MFATPGSRVAGVTRYLAFDFSSAAKKMGWLCTALAAAMEADVGPRQKRQNSAD